MNHALTAAVIIRYSFLHSIFSASIECSPRYKTTSKTKCKFHLKNNDQQDYSVLKWGTPLDGMTSDCLAATCNKKKLEYDGVYMKRGTPGPEQFLHIGAGETLSKAFDMSEAYDMTKAGKYTIKIDSYIEYTVGNVKGMNDLSKSQIQKKIVHLSSPAVSFQIVGGSSSRGTLGQKARFLEKRNQFSRNGVSKASQNRDNSLLDPIINGASAELKTATETAHGAAFNNIESAITETSNNGQRVKTWFGEGSASDANDVFTTMSSILKRDTITYDLYKTGCSSGTYAYTYKGSRKVYLCKLYDDAETQSGFDNKMGIIIHELSHALAYTDDIVYGQSACKQLARTKPSDAVKNADNFEYFVESK